MSNDRSAQLELYLDRLYGYAMSLSRNPDDSKDLVQDCALKALTTDKVPTDASAYRSWLFRILRNAFIDRYRKSKTIQNWETDASHLSESSMEYLGGDERLINVLSVKFEMAKLPLAQREIIGLIDVSGFSYEEVSKILDIPVGTVMSRISRARHTLITAIGDTNVVKFPVKRRK
ncbi:MAG: RNA polymerase subunit sigma-70 [Rhodospirillaceae bacterium]|nr:MAG: RNA polymerase subunit sigma-70 [Rhodospirillaceae bacterium]